MPIRISKKARADARAEFLANNFECTFYVPQFSFSSWEPVHQKFNSGTLNESEKKGIELFYSDWKESFERYNFCESKTVISEKTIQSYKETAYCIFATKNFTLKVNEFSERLAELYKYFKCQSSAFITGFNPYSIATDDVTNLEKNVEVSRFLKDNSFVFLNGEGKHPTNDWPAEAGFLIFGISSWEAKQLADVLQQNACLFADSDSIPKLIIRR